MQRRNLTYPSQTAIFPFLPFAHRVLFARRSKAFQKLDANFPYRIDDVFFHVRPGLASFELRIGEFKLTASTQSSSSIHLKGTAFDRPVIDTTLILEDRTTEQIVGPFFDFILNRPRTCVKFFTVVDSTDGCVHLALFFMQKYTKRVHGMEYSKRKNPEVLNFEPKLMKARMDMPCTFHILEMIVRVFGSQRRAVGSVVHLYFNDVVQFSFIHALLTMSEQSPRRAVLPYEPLSGPFEVPHLERYSHLQCLLFPMEHADVTFHWLPLFAQRFYRTSPVSTLLLVHVVGKDSLETFEQGDVRWTSRRRRVPLQISNLSITT